MNGSLCLPRFAEKLSKVYMAASHASAAYTTSSSATKQMLSQQLQTCLLEKLLIRGVVIGRREHLVYKSR